MKYYKIVYNVKLAFPMDIGTWKETKSRERMCGYELQKGPLNWLHFLKMVKHTLP